MSVMRHGTVPMYVSGKCRCYDCTVAASDNDRECKRRRREGAFATDTGYATHGEVREWVASLGFSIPNSMHGKKADALVSRYNREHPDRPYLRPSDGGVAS